MKLMPSGKPLFYTLKINKKNDPTIPATDLINHCTRESLALMHTVTVAGAHYTSTKSGIPDFAHVTSTVKASLTLIRSPHRPCPVAV